MFNSICEQCNSSAWPQLSINITIVKSTMFPKHQYFIQIFTMSKLAHRSKRPLVGWSFKIPKHPSELNRIKASSPQPCYYIEISHLLSRSPPSLSLSSSISQPVHNSLLSHLFHFLQTIVNAKNLVFVFCCWNCQRKIINTIRTVLRNGLFCMVGPAQFKEGGGGLNKGVWPLNYTRSINMQNKYSIFKRLFQAANEN